MVLITWIFYDVLVPFDDQNNDSKIKKITGTIIDNHLKIRNIFHYVSAYLGIKEDKLKLRNKEKSKDQVFEEEIILEFYLDLNHQNFYTLYKGENKIIKDSKDYDLGILNFQIFNYSKGMMKMMVVKIMKRLDHILLIKLFSPKMINWGSGPKDPSIYCWINTKTKKLMPIQISSIYVEFFDNFDLKHNDDFLNGKYGFDYETIEEIGRCCICFENKLEIYGYCDNFHLISCRNCSSLIENNCPICRRIIRKRKIVELI